MSNITISELKQNRGQVCNDLLRSLPNWFGIESAIQRYVSEVETMPTFVAEENGEIAGFVSLNLHNEWTAEIHVIAIHAAYHRKGIGKKLTTVAEDYLRNLNYKFLTVKTLSPSKPDEYYDRTRNFYFLVGFRPVEEFKTLWGPENPCLLMIKAI